MKVVHQCSSEARLGDSAAGAAGQLRLERLREVTATTAMLSYVVAPGFLWGLGVGFWAPLRFAARSPLSNFSIDSSSELSACVIGWLLFSLSHLLASCSN